MMSCCHHHHSCDPCNTCGCMPYCPYPHWKHPLLCNPAHFCCADDHHDNGPTLVIHQILLEPCGNQSCTPRTFTIRVTGPSYPCGEIFTLRAGSCLELDEPLVISGLTPGTYCIEALYDCPHTYIHTITGASCGGCVQVTESAAPTVVTIVSRRRFCRRNRCGCAY